ncbi:MAG TPA: hypothetical protein VF576_01425, partial [Rubricoccaceae bacterium]
MRLALLVALAALTSTAGAQSPLRAERGSREAERKGVLNANRVTLTVFNTGLSGGVGEIRGNWPAGSNDFYLGDLMFVVGAEVTDDTGAVVPVVAVPRGPSNRGIPSNPADWSDAWTWEAVPGYTSSTVLDETGQPNDRPAMSVDPRTWPGVWPDRRGDVADPGWAGAWDGLWGKDQFVDGAEIYSHLADDNVRTAAYTPDPEDPARGGLGLVTRQRAVALRDPGFEDGLLYVWDVVNTSPRDLARVAAGFVAGTLSGGDGDSQDDVVGHDAARGLVYSYDVNNRGNQGQTVGYTGFVVLPTPGGELGLGGARHLVPSSSFPLRDAALVWGAMEAGGLFPQNDCLATGGCDGDLFVSSTPFALPAFSEKRFAAAVVFGATLADLQRQADQFRSLAAGGLRFDDARVTVTGPGDVTTDGSVNVTWTSAEPTARVRLDVTANGGRTWARLGIGLPASGTFAFNAAARGPGVYRVRATAFTPSGVGRGMSGLITVQGTAPPVATLYAPRGSLQGVVAVSYEANGTTGSPLSVRLLDLRPDGTPFLLAEGLPESGTFAWDTRLAANGVHRLVLQVTDGPSTTTLESDPFIVANDRQALETPGTYAGRGDGAVEVRVAAPDDVTGHTYRVDFADGPWQAETYTVTDETTGQPVLGPTALPPVPAEGPLFDGLRLVVLNPETRLAPDSSGWTVEDGQFPILLTVADVPEWELEGRALPYDYTVAFSDAPVTESVGGIRVGTGPDAPPAVARLTNVTVTNTTLGRPAPFVFIARSGDDGVFSAT